jgi:hypothetical protein
MTEFTDEQGEEIKKLLDDVRKETKAQQQWAIAGDRATRLMVLACTQSVQNGADDPVVLDVASALRNNFIKANFTQPQEAKDEVAKPE